MKMVTTVSAPTMFESVFLVYPRFTTCNTTGNLTLHSINKGEYVE